MIHERKGGHFRRQYSARAKKAGETMMKVMREVTSFVSAASFWGVGRDVMELEDIVLKSTQVPIVKDDKGVCRMQTSLKVDRFAYDDAGSITMVQFVTGEGKKILWPEA